MITEAAVFYSRLIEVGRVFRGLAAPRRAGVAVLFPGLPAACRRERASASSWTSATRWRRRWRRSPATRPSFRRRRREHFERFRAYARQQGMAAGFAAGEVLASPGAWGTRDLMGLCSGKARRAEGGRGKEAANVRTTSDGSASLPLGLPPSALRPPPCTAAARPARRPCRPARGPRSPAAAPLAGCTKRSRRACRAWRASSTRPSAGSRRISPRVISRAAAVLAVAQHRAADVAQVDADLVRAARLRQHRDGGEAVEPLRTS